MSTPTPPAPVPVIATTATRRHPPVTGDPLDILINHNLWATELILHLCRPLTQAQFHQAFPIGPGSLHNALTHIIGAMLRWADRVQGPPVPLRPSVERPAPSPTGDSPTVFGGMPARTVDELLTLLHQADRDLRAAILAHRAGLTSVIDTTFNTRSYHFTRGAALCHALVHGAHHRAQCLNMLRHLNIPGLSDRLPDIDIVDWQATCETGEAAPEPA